MADVFAIDLAHVHAAVEGDLSTQSGLANLRQALINRWLTEPGQYAARPDYGAGLLSFQNKIMSLATQRELAKRIEEQTLRDLRVEKLIGIQVFVDDYKPDLFRLFVRIKPRGFTEYGINFSPFSGEA